MAIPLVIMAVAAAAAVAASAISRAVAQGDYDKARKTYADAVAQYGDIMVPELDKAVAEQVPESEFTKIKMGGQSLAQQMKVMSELDNVYQNEGMTQADDAAMKLADMGANARAGSAFQALEQQLAERGQAGNPAMLAAARSQIGGQTASGIAAGRYQAQIDARNRALSALTSSGQLASQIRDQDWQQAAARAAAIDATNRWNADQRTAAERENARRAESMFAMQMAKAGGINNARAGQAANYQAQGNATQQMGGQMANAISSIGGAAAGYMNKPSGPPAAGSYGDWRVPSAAPGNPYNPNTKPLSVYAPPERY